MHNLMRELLRNAGKGSLVRIVAVSESRGCDWGRDGVLG